MHIYVDLLLIWFEFEFYCLLLFILLFNAFYCAKSDFCWEL